MTREVRERKIYVARNEDTVSRTLVIEHPARPEWRLTDDAPKFEEKAPGLYRFGVNLEPKKTERLVLNEAKSLHTQYSLNAITDAQVGFFLMEKSINPAMEKALRSVLAQKTVLTDFDVKIKTQQKAVDLVFADQTRLRENMKALKGSAEEKILLQRYTKQLDDEETELAGLRKKAQDLQIQRDEANAALEKMIADLQLETVF